MQGRYSADAQAHLKRARSICSTGFPVPVSLGFSQIGVPKGRPQPPAPHAHFHTSGTASSQRPAAVGHGWLSLNWTAMMPAALVLEIRGPRRSVSMPRSAQGAQGAQGDQGDRP
ncbi:hypothetical protein OIDMADRAFT_47689 [Oidiodendron maius Zn]|uniref:Uncharacterized protein n=1 Tax=Oidiodendron maius (strain Zn) TaxID=913774 RepID=A0A0C3HHW7_OIDMZ|nr:hypothetical protein OIDMADRAFT_47689 [Oidiodendron maius Zn]